MVYVHETVDVQQSRQNLDLNRIKKINSRVLIYLIFPFFNEMFQIYISEKDLHLLI